MNNFKFTSLQSDVTYNENPAGITSVDIQLDS